MGGVRGYDVGVESYFCLGGGAISVLLALIYLWKEWDEGREGRQREKERKQRYLEGKSDHWIDRMMYGERKSDKEK